MKLKLTFITIIAAALGGCREMNTERLPNVAGEWFPAATSAALNEKALAAKTSSPETGFMKHFKRIAKTEPPRAEFDRIDREVLRRDGSGV